MRAFKNLLLVSVLLLALQACSTVVKSTANSGQATGDAVKSDDYLDKDVVLAAFSMEDGGYSETGFYPSTITVQAGKKTKYQYEAVSLIHSSDVGKGDKKWTKNVIMKSHPAVKKELIRGIVVLFVTDENPRNTDALKNHSVWHRGVVISVDELFKNRVKIMYLWHLDRKDESDRLKNIPLENIRIIDSPEIPAVKRFQK